jgi:hypothetical protein
MRYEAGELSGLLLALVYDCQTGEKLDDILWLDTDLKQYARLNKVTRGADTYCAARILVVGRVAYVNPQPARPLPDVRHLVKPKAKPWKTSP